LMMLLYGWSPGSWKGLKKVCEMYNIENTMPEVDGSMVASMDNDTLRKYVESDVQLVYELHAKMQGIYF